MLAFSDEELKRYSRHLVLQNVGIEGQKKISQAKVLVIGAGGLGSPVSLYLAAAGVGELGIIDDDSIDLSNLQRQIIHTTQEVGSPKVRSAAKKLNALNPCVKVNAYHCRFEASNALEIVSGYDVVVDGSDNFGTKFLVNDACVLANKPLCYGGILRFSGQVMSVKPRVSACYACIFDTPPPPDSVPSCSSAGVLGAIAGAVGSIQALEVLKIIIGIGQPLFNKILSIDALSMDFRKVSVIKNHQCRVCGANGIKELKNYEQASCWEL